ncbi:MAG: hypothetical protein KF820_07515 [Candidatus Paracaedibacteraceae bacterium]|nr:hypothetical protein [Candidatus Paracaedibacteraceae bacterium]
MYAYFKDPKDAKDIQDILCALDDICKDAERILGSEDYTIFFMPVHAYMKIKHYHCWAQGLINHSKGKNHPKDLQQASNTMMAMIAEAREKYGFDFYTIMEKDEKVRG